MSLRYVPSEEEVMGWNPQRLADYMRKLKLTSCDEVVLRSNINGTQFMEMSHCELKVFPGLYVPTLTLVQSDIKRGSKMNLFSSKSKTQKHLEKVCVKVEEGWDPEEFDNENVYESPQENDEDENYICALTELQIEEKHGGKTCRGNYMLQPMRVPRLERGATIQDCRGDRAERNLTQPHPPPTKTDHVPPGPCNAPTLYSDLKMVKIKKPELPCPSPKTVRKSKGSIVLPPRSSSIRPPQPQTPTTPYMFNRMTVHTPAPLAATKLAQERKSITEPKQMKAQSLDMHMGRRRNLDVDLDPSWYGGKTNRSLAEMALREVNKDGAFLVRASSASSADHPYTLMILNKSKVYNIKIRNQGNSYVLGSGLRNTQSFPGVKEMINHYTHTPLLLIDGRDQSYEEQPQCRLQHPVGI